MKQIFLGIVVLSSLAGPVVASAQGAEDAGTIYHNLCVTCHGATGNGDGPAAAVLTPKPKDFQDCGAMSKIADERLFNAIKGGGQSVGLSPLMPAWSASVTDPQIHALVTYIRDFCKR